MIKRIDLTPEQIGTYNRYIIARDKVFKNPKKWVRLADIQSCIDVPNLNHPLFVVNDEYIEFKNAFDDWLKVEPPFRQEERMRATRGDYESTDYWDEND
jgi:hypothetical protein